VSASGESRPAASIVMPFYGTDPAVLFESTRSLVQEYGSTVEVIVASSGTTDPPVLPQDVRNTHATARMLPAAAKNRGAGMARGGVLVFADADNTFAKGCVSHLLSVFEENRNVCAVGATTYFAAEPTRVAFLGATHRTRSGRTRFYSSVGNRASDPWTSHLVIVDVVANVYAVRSLDFAAIGGFDEVAFPSHYEESDLLYRLRARTGQAVVADTAAAVYNDMPVDPRRRLRAKDPMRSYYNARSRPIFVARHLSRWALAEYLVGGQFVAAGLYAWSEVRYARGSASGCRVAWDAIWAYIRGMADGLCSCIGEVMRSRG